jgi:hypothetical protein
LLKAQEKSMYPESRQTIHMGINFIVSSMPVLNESSKLRFQKSLHTYGIDFTQIKYGDSEIIVRREAPTRLDIQVAAMGPPSLGQLLILAPQPGCDLVLFTKEAEAIVKAFNSTWPAERRQVISSDVAFRDLFETTSEHAFQEIWEKRLGQSADTLAVLGRPVLGGGLRFVMPPQPNELEPVQIEVKIESFLRNTRKIYVETQFKWPQPKAPGEPLDPTAQLRQVDEYIETEILSFMT